MIFAAVFFVLFTTGSAQAAGLSERENALLSAVNSVRAAHDLRPLAVDTRLVRAARGHSATLIRRDVLTHGALGARLASYGVRGPLFGENLAWGVGSRSAARAVVGQWLASPGHRANLLRPGFRRIGLGARHRQLRRLPRRNRRDRELRRQLVVT